MYLYIRWNLARILRLHVYLSFTTREGHSVNNSHGVAVRNIVPLMNASMLPNRVNFFLLVVKISMSVFTDYTDWVATYLWCVGTVPVETYWFTKPMCAINCASQQNSV